MDQRDLIQKSEAEFYTRWPDLKNPQYAQQVDMGLRAYRQANPKAPFKEIVERAGLMLMISLGLNPQQQQMVPQAPDAPVLPGVPPIPAGRGGAGAPRSASAGATDVWSELIKEDEA